MEQLKFANPVFQSGLNVTIRLGSKWYHSFFTETTVDGNGRETQPVSVDIATADGKVIGKGQIEAVRECFFYEICAPVLALEHDPNCRTLSGLYQVMKGVYGNKFHAGSIVTIVFFTGKGVTL